MCIILPHPVVSGIDCSPYSQVMKPFERNPETEGLSDASTLRLSGIPFLLRYAICIFFVVVRGPLLVKIKLYSGGLPPPRKLPLSAGRRATLGIASPLVRDAFSLSNAVQVHCWKFNVVHSGMAD